MWRIPRSWKNEVPRDSQRSKVYAWERANLRDQVLLGDHTRRLIERVYRRYCLPTPEIRVVNDRYTWARGSDRIIVLPKAKSLNVNIILHECAHGLAMHYNYDKHDGIEGWHGRTFARILINLYVRYGDYDEKTFVASARERRVRLATKHSCPTPPIAWASAYREACLTKGKLGQRWDLESKARIWREQLPPAKATRKAPPNGGFGAQA